MNDTIPLLKEPVGPESRLLVLCARTSVETSTAKLIAELGGEGCQWDCLISLAARNSVTPLLELNLRKAAGDRPPAFVLARLSDTARAIAAKNLLLTAELTKVVGQLRSQDILVMPYKGPVLAAQAYGNVALREFDDLDIIVRQKDMAKAHEAMLSSGYAAKFPWEFSATDASRIPGEYNYYDQARQILVELHTEFTLRHFPEIPNLDDFASRLVPVSLGGRELQTFSPEDALPILCVHGSKDFWERLSWVVDISELIRSQRELDWDKILRASESLKVERMLHTGLVLASALLGAPLPSQVAARVHKDSVAEELAVAISRRLVDPGWSELDAASRFHFRRRMLPGLAGWQYAARLALAPAEEDSSKKPPRALAPFYRALRPLRLLRKYGWRAGRSS